MIGRRCGAFANWCYSKIYRRVVPPAHADTLAKVLARR
jgi:hypothetical protein